MLVAGTAVSFLLAWWTFKRGRGADFIFTFRSPTLTVGFRQMNVDFAICNALSYRTEGLPEALGIYDIACQWWINFFKRLLESPWLLIPEFQKLMWAVGSFHLSAHVKECFVLYSLHFIQGSGQIDGEILETLWKEFNKVSPSTRSMSAAHRKEVCDDFMRDSNWKKLVGICGYAFHDTFAVTERRLPVSTESKKYSRAVKGLRETYSAYQGLSDSLTEEQIDLWRAQEEDAMEHRGEYLRIYEVKSVRGIVVHWLQWNFFRIPDTLSGRAIAS